MTRLRQLCEAYEELIAETGQLGYPLIAQIDIGGPFGPVTVRYNATAGCFLSFNDVGWLDGLVIRRPDVVQRWHENYDVKLYSVSINSRIAFTPKVYFDSAEDGTKPHERATLIISDSPPFQ